MRFFFIARIMFSDCQFHMYGRTDLLLEVKGQCNPMPCVYIYNFCYFKSSLLMLYTE